MLLNGLDIFLNIMPGTRRLGQQNRRHSLPHHSGAVGHNQLIIGIQPQASLRAVNLDQSLRKQFAFQQERIGTIHNRTHAAVMVKQNSCHILPANSRIDPAGARDETPDITK